MPLDKKMIGCQTQGIEHWVDERWLMGYAACLGDLNVDGIIGIGDLLMMLGEFGCPEDCSHDMNNDGGVTTSDMLIMLSLFGTDCPE